MLAEDGGKRPNGHFRQVVQVGKLPTLLRVVFTRLQQGGEVLGQARKAFAFADDVVAELLVQLGRQVGVHQHFGVAADGCERGA